MHPSSLPWSEVDPRRVPFDPAEAVEVAGAAVAAVSPGEDRRRVQEVLDEAFGRRFGPWAHGWLWGRDEGQFDGGPVQGWCCPTHAVLWPEEGRDLRPTARRAAAALADWRSHLERMADLFDSLPPARDDGAGPRRLEEATVALVAFSVEETGCGSGWYGHAGTVLDWYLQRWGASPRAAGRAARRALAGRFDSWIEPAEEALDQVRLDFGRSGWRALSAGR